MLSGVYLVLDVVIGPKGRRTEMKEIYANPMYLGEKMSDLFKEVEEALGTQSTVWLIEFVHQAVKDKLALKKGELR